MRSPAPTAALTVLACAGTGAAQELTFPDFAKYAQIWSGAKTEIKDETYAVIDDEESWTNLWRRHDPAARVPPVDFRHAMVVCVFHPAFTSDGFHIDRIVRGSLMSDLSSFNVFLTPAEPSARGERPRAPNRYEMVRVDRTRLDFRFYTRGQTKTAARGQLVARVDPLDRSQPAASLGAAARELMAEYRAIPEADAANRERVMAKILAFGPPLRPFLSRWIAERSGGADFWVARKVLDLMLAEEVLTTAKAVRHSEVALGKALAEVNRRLDTKGEPWYVKQQVRYHEGVWYVDVTGTFTIFSDFEMSSQPGVCAKVALRAQDGKLILCEVKRGGR